MQSYGKLFWLPLFVLLSAAVVLQCHLELESDVAYLIHASSQLLAGGHYGSDIFETNPPLIFYLYAPVIWLTHMSSLNITILAKLYIFILATLSAGLCYYLLNQLIAKDAALLRCALWSALLINFFILPLYQFGQREHLLLMFTFPYLLAAALTLKKIQLSLWLTLIIGAVAALGFGLKPYFLPTLILVESLIMLYQRRFFSWARPEVGIIVFMLFAYVYSIAHWQPEYFSQILPLVQRYYIPYISIGWQQLVTYILVWFFISLLFFYSWLFRKTHYPELSWVSLAALAGFVVAFVWPGTLWFYHVMPALGLALFLIALGVGQLFPETHESYTLSNILPPLAIAATILAIPVIQVMYIFVGALDFSQERRGMAEFAYFKAQRGPRSMVCMAAATMDCFPLVYSLHAEYGQRYPGYWWLNGLRAREHAPLSAAERAQLRVDKRNFVDNLSEDLSRFHTRWVMVNKESFVPVKGKQLNIIKEFQANPKFAAVWRHYHLVHQSQYHDIYERNDKESLKNGA